ncbi:ssDNA binding protein [Vibrio phage YC]|uniref:Single-stranded DNA-binding protein n=1 Tax=Vibrio phage YC TaxID=2267403 RepID=A0A384ZRY0_9CAUD|nr:ssDNA binding protein [Vibrio phage YC]AXC34399.1 ssDNA binding protein [Vibrio phage YC]
MSNSILDRLKKTRGQGRASLQQSLESRGQGGFKKDERIWNYKIEERDGKLLSTNVIRFLTNPLCDIEAQEKGDLPADFVLSPCVLRMRHWFKGPGGSYSEISPQSIGNECPVREYDRSWWAHQKETKDEALKDKLKKRLPKKEYYANILVIKDDQNPDNEGKVMLFKFGEGIKNVIDKAANPDFPTDPVIEDVFCMYEGAELTINIVGRKGKYEGRETITPNFQNSQFIWGEKKPLFVTADGEADEDKIAEIWQQCHSLWEFADPSQIKDYDVLADRLRKVMGLPEGAPLVGLGSKAEAQVGQAPDNSQPKRAQDMMDEDKPSDAASAGAQAQQAQADDSADIDDFEKMLMEAENG